MPLSCVLVEMVLFCVVFKWLGLLVDLAAVVVISCTLFYLNHVIMMMMTQNCRRSRRGCWAIYSNVT